MKNGKRILSVTLKRMVDDSPDTSWLGEYSNRPNSEFSIDRAHSLDCSSVDPKIREAKEKLERVADYLESVKLDCGHFTWHGDCPYCAEMMDAHDSITELAQDIDECDCSTHRHWSGREYRYFNPPVENYKGIDADETRKYCLQDYDRMESLNNGNWCFIGIRAEATICVGEYSEAQITDARVFPNRFSVQTQTITSGGLWGVESDSDKSYFEEVEQEQLAELRAQLKALGFSSRAISTAFKNVERKES